MVEVATLYLLGFPSGKSYIGMTSIGMKARLRCHRAAKAGILQHALKKYGDPCITLLVQGERSYIQDLERAAIVAYGTMAPNGYNLTAGGDGFGSEAMKEYWRDPQFRAKAIAGMRNGKPRSGDTYKTNLFEFRLDPERKKKWRERLAATRRRYWEDPEKRKEHGRKVRETMRRKKNAANT